MLVLIQTETFRCEGRKGKNVGSDLIFENNSDISTAWSEEQMSNVCPIVEEMEAECSGCSWVHV